MEIHNFWWTEMGRIGTLALLLSIGPSVLSSCSSEDGMTQQCKAGITAARHLNEDAWVAARSDDQVATPEIVKDYYLTFWAGDTQRAKAYAAKVLSSPDFDRYFLRRTEVSFHDPKRMGFKRDIVCSWLTSERSLQPTSIYDLLYDGNTYLNWTIELSRKEDSG